MKIRVYDNTGQEKWARAGEFIPAGWYDSDCQVLTKPRKVIKIDDERGYEGKPQKILILQELN